MSTALFRLEHIETNDEGEIQTVHAHGYSGERLEDIIRVQPHGFSSNPPVGSHGVGLRLRDESDLAVALGVEHQDHRPRNLKPGQAAVYDDSKNASSYLGKDGILHDSGDNPQRLTGKTITLKASSGNASIGSKDGRTYLGGDGTDGTYAAVMTEAGPSSVVFAKI